MRRLTSNPKDFGRVAVLMGEDARFASTARCAAERPAMDGRAGLSNGAEVAPGMAVLSRPEVK
jgi:hypothetical protein